MQAVACCLSLWEQYAPKLRPQGIKPFLGIKIASSGSDIQSNFIDQISQSNQPFLKRELLYTEWWLLLHHVKFEPPIKMFRYTYICIKMLFEDLSLDNGQWCVFAPALGCSGLLDFVLWAWGSDAVWQRWPQHPFPPPFSDASITHVGRMQVYVYQACIYDACICMMHVKMGLDEQTSGKQNSSWPLPYIVIGVILENTIGYI